jgi:phospholipase/lecithinase/hemolysin
LDANQRVDLRDVAAFQKGFGRKLGRMLRVVVFGDGLSDTGNHPARFGTPIPPYWEGRSSDGPIWVEDLAGDLRLPTTQVKNYAVGGAASDHRNSGRPDGPGMLDELNVYLADVEASNITVDSDTLYVIWIGANDFGIWNQTNAFTTVSPDVLVLGAIENSGL